jgi:hypothetical protein
MPTRRAHESFVPWLRWRRATHLDVDNGLEQARLIGHCGRVHEPLFTLSR